MNRFPLSRVLAALLVLCILVVGGLASAQSITHESHHAHHQKSTHGTVFCSWMCAAGQGADGITAPPLIEQDAVSFADHDAYRVLPHVTYDSTTSRGPPSPSLR